MKISNEIGFFSRLVGESKTVELYAKEGFDAWDFTLTKICSFDHKTRSVVESDHPLAGPDRLKFARELRHIGEEMGIYCNQSHAPFPVAVPQIRDSLKHAIECTAEAGGSICIINHEKNKGAEENGEMYFELLPFAKECGVKIATENMWNWDKERGRAKFAACATEEDFCKHIDVVNDPYLIACLDIGHAEMMGDETSAVKMIHALGSRLQALHIHDNDRIHDSHQIPFSMDIDFDPIVKALAEIKYSGEFTLECCNYPLKFAAEDALQAAKDLADSARRLANKYDEYLKL
jgi:sugar phosphate isomerase/epimerase